MAVFSGFRPFLNKGSTLNGVQNTFFANSVNGFHYVPNLNISDVYSTSTTASFGSSINSIVDKKIGTTTGTEIVSNGSFSGIANGTDVTTISGWNGYGVVTARDIQGEKLRLVTTTTNTGALYVFNSVVGRTYQVLFEYSGDGIGNVYTNTAAIANQTVNASGSASFLVTAAQTVMYLFFRPNGNNPGTGYYDNISIREVSGNPAVQSSSSLRPLIGKAPKVRTNLINSSEDLTTWVNASVTTTADKVMETSTVDMHVSRAPSQEIYSNTDYYFTVEVKAAEKNYAVIGAWWTGGVAAGGIIFNLTTGLSVGDWARSPGNISATFISSENLGDGWWRVKVYINNLSNVIAAHPIVGLTNSTATVINEVYAGTNGHGVFVRKAHASITPFTTYQKTELNRLITTDSTQTSYPFIRLDLSDDILTTSNLVSSKNLLRYTEEFDNAAWLKQGVAVTANTGIAPDGTTTADLMYPLSTGTYRSVYQTVTAGNIISVYAKASGVSHLWFVNTSGGFGAAWFNLSTGVKGTVASGYTHDMVSVGNGWYRCTMRADSGTFYYAQIGLSDADNSNTVTVSGTNGVLIWGSQLELGSAATDYDYGGTKGTIIVAGKNGSAIETVYSPDGNFSLGPTTYTGGTPGILQAVGDIVGYTLSGRTTTSIEQDLLLDFYKSRGAKGRLIAGPELVTNGTFNTNLDSWTLGGGYQARINNSLELADIGNVDGTATQNITMKVGGIYLLSADVTVIDSGAFWLLRALDGVDASIGGQIISGNYKTVFRSSQISNRITALSAYTQKVQFDNISVKELRPKEEW